MRTVTIRAGAHRTVESDSQLRIPGAIADNPPGRRTAGGEFGDIGDVPIRSAAAIEYAGLTNRGA